MSTVAKSHLENGIGFMIRWTQEKWDGLSKDERNICVNEYRVMFGLLTHASGQRDPAIPSPWTDDEVFESMRDYTYSGEYFKSTDGMLTVTHSRLVNAVRVADRVARRSKKRPF